MNEPFEPRPEEKGALAPPSRGLRLLLALARHRRRPHIAGTSSVACAESFSPFTFLQQPASEVALRSCFSRLGSCSDSRVPQPLSSDLFSAA